MDIVGLLKDKADDLARETSHGLFWYCQISHFLLVINGVKLSWSGSKAKSLPHLTWILSMICCYGGGMIAKLLVGGKPLVCFDDNATLMCATLIWWLVFYFPFDYVSKMLSNTVVLSVLYLFKEVLRSRKVIKGVTMGLESYPDSFFSPLLLGAVASCGGSFLKGGTTLITRQWTPKSILTYKASFVTRCCLFFSLLHILYENNVISEDICSHNLIALAQAVVVYLLTMIRKFYPTIDPTDYCEKSFSYFFCKGPEKLIKLCITSNDTPTTKSAAGEADTKAASETSEDKKKR